MIGHAWWNLVWILLIVTLTHGQQDGDARISNIFPDITGAPEVFFDGQWGGMCAFNITSATAGVICTQLALGGGYIVGTRKRPAAVDNLAGMQCTGSEKVVASCPGARLQRINCSLSGDELVVGCKSRAPPVPLELAVTRATSASEEGAVRVEYNGVLGYICADKWEDSDAAVACDMLGYKQGRAGSSVSVTGSFFMSELSCSGTEQYLNDCPFTFMPASCASGRAASVTCGDPKAGSSGALSISPIWAGIGVGATLVVATVVLLIFWALRIRNARKFSVSPAQVHTLEGSTTSVYSAVPGSLAKSPDGTYMVVPMAADTHLQVFPYEFIYKAVGGFQEAWKLPGTDTDAWYIGELDDGRRIGVRLLPESCLPRADIIMHAQASLPESSGILRCIGWVSTPPMLVYNLPEGGCLAVMMPMMDHMRRLRIIMHVAEGLARLHSVGKLHLCVRPAAIFLTAGFGAMLADVDIYARGSPPEPFVPFTDPVQAFPPPARPYADPALSLGTVDSACDVYSLGLTILRCLTGLEPPEAKLAAEHLVSVVLAEPPNAEHRVSNLPELHSTDGRSAAGGDEILNSPPMSLSSTFAPFPDQHANALELLDPAVEDWPLQNAVELATLALKCCDDVAVERPPIQQVVNTLRQLLDDLQALGAVDDFNDSTARFVN